MKDTEIVEKIEEFSDFLSVGNAISDMVRWLGWVFIKGFAFIVDGLENITNEVLLIKQFFQNPEIEAFVDTIRPFLYILLAFSLVYAGYLLIMQKKFDREGMAMNLFIALAIVVALSQGMGKANEFTDDAINAINTTDLYDEGEGSLSDNIISRQLTDLMEFDKGAWETTEIDPSNTLPLSMINHLSVTEKINEERSDLELKYDSKEILSHKLTWSVKEKELVKLENSMLMPWTNESYYRYDINWLTLLTTLAVMAFTLFSIAYKLARLSFELTFNYILTLLVAPADIHDGQKTKKIMQSILNTFLVIILIFLSMKVYMIGTSYIAAELDGLAYLIALIAFSVAVIDGPNIVERLFGIDAGLKNGWGVLAGAYAGGKLISGAGGAAMNTMSRSGGSRGSGNSAEGDGEAQDGKVTGGRNKSGSAGESTASPNASEDKGGVHGAREGTGRAVGFGIVDKKGINAGLEEKKDVDKNGQPPSPNDGIELSKTNAETNGTSGSDSTTSANTASAKGNLSTDEKGPQEPSQGTETSGGHIPSPNDLGSGNSTASGINGNKVGSSNSAPSPNDAERSGGGFSSMTGSGNVQSERVEQRSTDQVDYEVGNVNEQTAGNATFSDNTTGNVSPSASASPNGAGIHQTDTTTAPSERQQRTTNMNRSGGGQTIDEGVMVNETQETATPGSTNVDANTHGSSNVSSSTSPNIGRQDASVSSRGQERSENSSGASSRQQNTTNINHSGGSQTVDENVVVNETQGTRNVTSNTSGTSGGGGFNSEAPSAPGPSSSSSGGSNRTINQNSSSSESIINETTVNRNEQQHTQQTDRNNVNESRRPRTHNLNQQDSNTLDRIKNYRRNR